MATIYVIQVWAYHGSGMQGWRTVSRRVGEHYRFRTRNEALQAMRTHFGNLREGSGVRVHEIADHTDKPTTSEGGVRPERQ
jgi:hypothetical protein